MKRLLLIVLIVSMCVSVVCVDSVLAKVKFGNWERWDEELPPADSESWKLVIEKGPMPVSWGPPGGDNIILITPLFFSSKGEGRVIVMFYLLGDIDIKNWDSTKVVTNATFALAAFPPKGKKMIIRAYKMNEDQAFKFYEEWKISFKNDQPVVPKDAEFKKIFNEFIVSQMERIHAENVFQKIDAEKFSAQFLPHIQILGKTYLIQAP